MPERVRKIIPHSTRLHMENAGLNSDIPYVKMPEERILSFCDDCDKLKSNNACRLLGDNNQVMAARKGSCRWASVDTIRGRMTTGGFVAGRK